MLHPGKQRWLRWILLIFALAAADLSASVLFRDKRTDSFRVAHDTYHHGMLPDRSGPMRWGKEQVTYHTNSLGLRDREIRDVPLRSEGHRVLFMGDSFLEGVGVPWEETVAGRVEDAVRGQGIDILDGAVIGYSPKLYLEKTRHLLDEQGLEVDEVFVFLDMSDIHDEVLYEHFEPRPSSALSEWMHAAWAAVRRNSFVAHALYNLVAGDRQERLQERYPWLLDLEQQSPEVQQVLAGGQQLNDLWSRDEQAWRVLGEPGVRLATQHMEELLELLRERGIPLTLFIHPWKTQILAGDLENRQVAIWSAWCRDHDVRFVNLFPEFIGEGLDPRQVIDLYFIPRDVHWSARGHQRVARRVVTELSERMASR